MKRTYNLFSQVANNFRPLTHFVYLFMCVLFIYCVKYQHLFCAFSICVIIFCSVVFVVCAFSLYFVYALVSKPLIVCILNANSLLYYPLVRHRVEELNRINGNFNFHWPQEISNSQPEPKIVCTLFICIHRILSTSFQCYILIALIPKACWIFRQVKAGKY